MGFPIVMAETCWNLSISKHPMHGFQTATARMSNTLRCLIGYLTGAHLGPHISRAALAFVFGVTRPSSSPCANFKPITLQCLAFEDYLDYADVIGVSFQTMPDCSPGTTVVLPGSPFEGPPYNVTFCECNRGRTHRVNQCGRAMQHIAFKGYMHCRGAAWKEAGSAMSKTVQVQVFPSHRW